MRAHLVTGIGWLLALAGLLDGVGRQLTRRSAFESLLGQADISPWWAAVVAVVGGVLIVSTTPVARRHTRVSAVLLTLFVVGTAAQLHLGARLQSDGFYYYAFTRSMWFDRDVNLTNDYALLGIDDPQHQFLLKPTVTGYAQSAWAIGPAVAWMPFFGVGHLAAHVLASQGDDIKTDGTSFPYRQAVCLAGLFYGLLGLWWSYRLARIVADASMATLAVCAIGGGSFVLWYLVREPTMSHSVSMASVAAFTLMWIRHRSSTRWQTWATLGLVGGLMVIMRWQNAIVLLLPAAGLLAAPRLAAAFAVGVFAGTVPQMWTWHALYGAWITQPPVSPRLLWWNAQWVDVLWSSRSGLFATSPAAYVGAIGLVLVWRRHRWLAGVGLLTLVLMTWTNGAVEDWWAGASYGGRRFDSLIPFLVCGCAALFTSMTSWIRTRPALTAVALVSLLVVWNVTLMAVARSGAYRIGQIVSFGDLAAAQATVAHGWIGHPASFPANMAWALTNGVTPDRFDLLRPNRFLGEAARPYGRIDIGAGDADYIGTGWHGVERDGDLTFRWTEGTATLVVPLDHAAPLRLQASLRPFEADGLVAQTVTAVVNGHRLPDVTLTGGWQRVELPTESAIWRSGINHVSLVFGRETRPADLGGGDGRRLAAAVDYVRIQKR
jgi:hypothetical protein